MKRVYITLLLIASFVLYGINEVMAQEGSVEIVTTYVPEIASATKLLAPTAIDDEPTLEPEINYNVKPTSWQIALEAHDFKPARASYWDYTGYKQLFAKAAVAYPFGSEARLRYTIQTPKYGYFGVGVDHLGDFASRLSATGVVRSVGESFNMQNRVLLGGGIFAGSRMFEASLLYDNDIFNGYAMESPERRMFHDAKLALRYGDDFVDLQHLNFAVELNGGLWSHKFPQFANAQIEYNAGAKVKLARDFSGNEIGVELDFDMWRASRELNYGDTRFGVEAGYARSFGFFSVEAGLGYIYDKVNMRDQASHFVLPRAKFMFDLEKASFVPYVDINTSVAQNGISKLYSVNPYIDYTAMATELSAMANSCNYNLALGFTGTVLASRLSYHVYAGVSFMRDAMFWYVTEPGKFGVEADNNNRIFMGVGAKYLPIAGLELDIDFYYHFDNNKSQYELAESAMRGNASVKYTLRDWQFFVRCQLLGNRSWSVLPSTAGEQLTKFTMPTTFDLGAGVSYRVSRIVEVYAEGQNLLNSKHIYDYAYYYRPGIGVKAGVKIDF